MRWIVDKRLIVRTNATVLDGGQDADFIECVLFLLLGELAELDLFQSVGLVVRVPPHQVHTAVGALSCLESRSREALTDSFEDLELVD